MLPTIYYQLVSVLVICVSSSNKTITLIEVWHIFALLKIFGCNDDFPNCKTSLLSNPA